MNTSDVPQFSKFCEELTTFYENDDLAPGLHVSYIDQSPDAERLWYIAIHRYPYTGTRRIERVVVCNQTRPSFGVALLNLYQIWLKIRDLSYEEEERKGDTLNEDGRPINASHLNNSGRLRRRGYRR